VITVTPVSGIAEAIRFAGDAAPGSGLSIFTTDVAAATEAVGGIASGIFFINDPRLADAGPFGGMRDAGLRRAFRIAASADAPEGRVLHVAERLESKTWWFPYRNRKIS